MKRYQWTMASEIGPLYLVASEKGLQAVLWDKQAVNMADTLTSPEPQTQILAQAVAELEEYFAGRREKFSVPLDIAGTTFQKLVWEQLRQIPYGKTYSYKEIAERISHKKAMRAVGSANGRNPLSIIVPCHRVIAANGTLGGYSGGLNIKTKLLNIERQARQVI